jgi:hypothetical protein
MIKFVTIYYYYYHYYYPVSLFNNNMIKFVTIFLKKTQCFQIAPTYNSLYHYIVVCAHEYTHVYIHMCPFYLLLDILMFLG